jgi:hypothetical protein
LLLVNGSAGTRRFALPSGPWTIGLDTADDARTGATDPVIELESHSLVLLVRPLTLG